MTGDLLANDSDLDTSDALTVSQVGTESDELTDVIGAFGTLDWSADGSFSYTLDNGNPAVQALAAGQTVTDLFDYLASDGNGGTAPARLTVTITGVNDAPLTANDTSTIAEDTTTPASGNLLTNDTDVDNGEALLLVVTEVDGVTDQAVDVAGLYGTLDWNADGSFSYTLDNTDALIQTLAVGQTLLETFPYTATDSQGATDSATLTITITGHQRSSSGHRRWKHDRRGCRITGQRRSVGQRHGSRRVGYACRLVGQLRNRLSV